jgi:ATP-dependent DNA helicase RecG
VSIDDAYTAADFAMLVEREGDRVELKTGTSQKKLQEPIVGFSNTAGGVIFIGVTDARIVQGRALDQGTEDAVHEAAMATFHPGRYSMKEVDVAGVPVVAVEVRRREEGFAQTSDGRLLVRKGARNVALIGDEAFAFMSSRALRRFEASDSEIPIGHADPDALAELCYAFGWSPTSSGLPDRLRERGLAGETNLTIAGALLLTDPARSLGAGKAVVEVRRYSDDGPDYNRREVFGGHLGRQIREATDFVIKEIGSDLIVAGVHRYDLPRLPPVVVRESVANAVAHRNYEVIRTAIVVEVRGATVSVTSPGSLPEPVTVSTIRESQAARNPSVIDGLRRLRLAEDAGRGVDVMEDEMEAALLDPPVFADNGTMVTVTLPLQGPITNRERGWLSDLERRGELESHDKLLLVHAARGTELSNSAARGILKTSDSGVARRSLQRLRDAGLLVQHGDRGGAIYTLEPSLHPPAAYRLNTRQLAELVMRAARDEVLTNERVREITGLERFQALQLLRGLVDDGALVQRGQRRGTYYALPDDTT